MKFKSIGLLILSSLLIFSCGLLEDMGVGKLDNLSGVSISESTTDGLQISWNAIDGAESYSIYMQEGGSGEFEFDGFADDILGTPFTFYNFEDGVPGTSYSFKVTWNDGSTKSELGEATVVTAVYPEPSTGIKSIDSIYIGDGLPGTYSTIGDCQMEFTVQGEVDEISYYMIYKKYSGRTSDYDEGSMILYYHLEESGDNSYTYDFSLPINATDDDGNAFCVDGVSITYKLEALDVDGNVLGEATKSFTPSLNLGVQELNYTTDNGDLILEWNGSSEVTEYRIYLPDGYTFDTTGMQYVTYSKSELTTSYPETSFYKEYDSYCQFTLNGGSSITGTFKVESRVSGGDYDSSNTVYKMW